MAASIPSGRVLTVLEHQSVPVSADGAGFSLTPVEVERLARIGELRPGFCDIGHRKVTLAQYCGLVSLGERVLEVLPKTQDREESAEACRGVLLRLLRLTDRFPQFQHLPVGQQLRRVPLLEAFIAAFFDAVAVVIRGGLLKQYQEREDDLGVVRGRIVLARQAGVHANRPDMVACAFDELTVDNGWNRGLKKAVRSTRPWIRGADLHRRWVELMGVLEEVDDTGFTAAALSRLVFDRKAERYRAAMAWARWILSLLAPMLRAGQAEAPALLFDMNKLFESAVTSVLRRQLLGTGCSLSAQDSTLSFASVEGAGRIDAGYHLRPDLVIRRGHDVVAIADVKWKLPDTDRFGRVLPALGDLYQLHAYASVYGCGRLWIVYPRRNGVGGEAGTMVHLPSSRTGGATVKMAMLDLEQEGLGAGPDTFDFLHGTTMERTSVDQSLPAKERFLGCLLGGAVGDALGAPVEFMQRAEILRRFGPEGITTYAAAYGGFGTITDDTQMTLFTAEGLLRAWVRGCEKGITTYAGVTAHAYLRWLQTQGEQPTCDIAFGQNEPGWLFQQVDLHHRRAPGNTCLAALKAMRTLGEPARNDSKGCGGLMRVAPVGLFAWRQGKQDAPQEVFRLGAELAALTHGHPTGSLTAGVLAVLVLALVDGTSLPEALAIAKTCLRSEPDHQETLRAIEGAEALATSGVAHEQAIRQLGEGWIAEEALAISLYCAMMARDFRHGVILAVNHDGDSDSTGAIVGNLLGAMHGVRAIPAQWLEPLELREVITEVAEDLYGFRDWPIGEYAEPTEWGERTRRRYPGF